MSTFATNPALAHRHAFAFGSIVRALVAFVRAAFGRREVTRLLELDDHMLKDIGLVRADVVGALAAPLAQDPSVLLRLRSVEQRARLRARAAPQVRALAPVRRIRERA